MLIQKNLENVLLVPSFEQLSPMSIDSLRITEDIAIFLIFLSILLISFFSGYFGPYPYTTESEEESFKHVSPIFPPKYEYSIKDISPINSFLSISLILERKIGITPSKGSVSFLIDISKSNITSQFSRSFNPIPAKFQKASNFSQPILIFTDQAFDYSLIRFQALFSTIEAEYNGATILVQIGNPESFIYGIFFRFLFFAILIFFLVLLISRLKSLSRQIWFLEQKLTIILLIIVSLYVFPFYEFIFLNYPLFYLLDAFFTGLAISFSIFFILILFDRFRVQNQETNFCFLYPKIAISLINFAFIFSKGLFNVLTNFTELRSNELLKFWNSYIQVLISISLSISSIYILIIIMFSYLKCDSTEKYKLNLYAFSFSICLLVGFVGYLFKNDTALLYPIQYTLISLFSIIMAYFHWPYEMKNDQIYNEHL